MLNMNGTLFTYIMAGVITCIVGVIILLGYIQVKRNNQGSVYNRQLEDLLSDDSELEMSNKLTLSVKWNLYWGRIAKESGIHRYADANNSAGRDVLVSGIVIAIAISALFQNILAGIVISIGLIFAASVSLRTMSNKKVELLNNQLPGFLFALKSNVVAGETLEKAFVKIADIMPYPLREDLTLVKNRILANVTFKESLEELYDKTASDDLRFLCACMIQSQGTGVSLEEQITTVQEVLEEKQKVSHEIAKGLKSVTPSLWAASVVIPGSFIVSYFMDFQAREFWFNGLISWIALGLVAVLWAVGLYGTKKMADNIRNL